MYHNSSNMTILSAVVQWAKCRACCLKEFSSNLTKSVSYIVSCNVNKFLCTKNASYCCFKDA